MQTGKKSRKEVLKKKLKDIERGKWRASQEEIERLKRALHIAEKEE